MTCRTLLAPYLPRGFSVPAPWSEMTPARVAVLCSYFAEWDGRRRWCFPIGGALTGLNRERFEIVRDALVRYFTAAGRGMAWMRGDA